MPPIPSLFKLAIEPKGSITCTQPSPRVYLLTFDSPPDNRLTPGFCAVFLLALDIVDRRFDKGVIVTTSTIPKFYSNGLDFESAFKSKSFFPESLYPLWKRLLTFVFFTTLLRESSKVHTFSLKLVIATLCPPSPLSMDTPSPPAS